MGIVEDVNEELETAEQSKKDEMKHRRGAFRQEQTLIVARGTVHEQECHFVGIKRACRLALVIHISKKHSRA